MDTTSAKSDQVSSRTWKSRAIGLLKRISLVAWLSVAATGVGSVVAVLTSINDIRDFFGWKRQAEYMEHVSTLIETLEETSAAKDPRPLVPRAKWTISRLVAIGETEENQRAGLSVLIADYIRSRAAYRRSASKKGRGIRQAACPDDVKYAVQVLGSCPLRGSWIGGTAKYLDMRVVGLPRVYLQKRYFHQVDFADGIFFKSNLIEAQFIDCNLSGADLDSTRAVNACFDNSSLDGAHFIGASLAGATFRNASLKGTDFTGACLRGCDFSGAKDFMGTKWSAAHIVDIIGAPGQLDSLMAEGSVKNCSEKAPDRRPAPVRAKCGGGFLQQ